MNGMNHCLFCILFCLYCYLPLVNDDDDDDEDRAADSIFAARQIIAVGNYAKASQLTCSILWPPQRPSSWIVLWSIPTCIGCGKTIKPHRSNFRMPCKQRCEFLKFTKVNCSHFSREIVRHTWRNLRFSTTSLCGDLRNGRPTTDGVGLAIKTQLININKNHAIAGTTARRAVHFEVDEVSKSRWHRAVFTRIIRLSNWIIA